MDPRIRTNTATLKVDLFRANRLFDATLTRVSCNEQLREWHDGRKEAESLTPPGFYYRWAKLCMYKTYLADVLE
jgi:hypothetical protein